MNAHRSEFHELIDAMPDDEVARALTDVRRRTHTSNRHRQEPFAWFAMGPSTHGRTDDARRIDEILEEGFGRR